jgi:Bacterial SH3 domain
MNAQNLPKLRTLLLSVIAILTVAFSAGAAHGQVVLTIKKNVKVHPQPKLTSEPIDGLPSGAVVTLIEGSQHGNFFKVTWQGKSGWVDGRYLLVPSVEPSLGPVFAAAPLAAPAFPLCGPERHYRWEAKITTSGFDQAATNPSVNAALNWSTLSFSGHDLLSWCNPRVPKEKKPFTIVGWVRRIMKEDDGDVHVEITQNSNDPVEKCFVVEIPPADLSPRFSKARNDLLSLLGLSHVQNKDFDSPKRVRFTGLAFWDGWHATSDLPIKHGRCNSTKGAAWELHPVFKVVAP